MTAVKVPLMREPEVAGYSMAAAERPDIPVVRSLPFVVSGRGTRMHRPRSATISHYAWADYQPTLHVRLWCGQSLSCGRYRKNVLFAATPLDGWPVCGTCEGRAIGVGLPTTEQIITGELPDRWELLFSPRDAFAIPRRCPGSGHVWSSVFMDDPDNPRRGLCPWCGASVKVRGHFAGGANICAHPPGPDLEPCPRHGYDHLGIPHHARRPDSLAAVVCLPCNRRKN